MIAFFAWVAFFGGLTLFYLCCAHFLERTQHDATNSLKILACTYTNNNYPSFEDSLSKLDKDVEADMRGYMPQL